MGREKSILIITIFSLISLSLSSLSSSSSLIRRKLTTQDISNSCSKTRYPSLCVKSLLDHPDSANLMNRLGLVRVSFNVTLRRVEKALDGASNISDVSMDKRVRSAYDDCLELLNDSMYQLVRSLSSIGSKNKQTLISNDDVMTWLSAALTNHDTCTDGFEGVTGYVKDRMDEQLKDLSQLVSNCLALFKSVKGAGSSNGDFSGIPIQNRRRKLLGNGFQGSDSGFPSWVKSRERKLLEMSVSDLQPSIVVSKDGNGTYRTIAEAIKAAPQNSDRRTIIYVKAGRYEEDNLKVGIKKTNLMFIGDGKSVTIISGGKSVADNLTTFHTAAFAATGSGFIVRDITFTNWAGPAKHQAVALRVGADHAVVYRCNIIGYQDSLYVHSQRQFFRECDIYGTVDFIFGNAAVVFQNCGIYARKPMAQQKNTITAQNRKDPNQNTGISIHNCKILATPDLEEAKNVTQTYLGRPWKLYARTVYLMSYMSDHIHPLGWLEWSDTFALDTLYYGEYLNSGPGAPVGQRVKWPGYHVMTSSSEASKFTVGQFLLGSSWLPSTGVTYVAGLSV